MNRYQGLKNICMIWVLLSLVIGILIGGVGALAIARGNLIGIAYIIGALAIVLLAQTLDHIIALLIDMAASLHHIATLNEPESAPASPQTGIRKLPKG